MLDQSFSSSNFRTIFDIANRNGYFVEDKLSLGSIRKFTNGIKVYSQLAKNYKKAGDISLSIFFDEVKEDYRDKRNLEIDNVLKQVSNKKTAKNFEIQLKVINIPNGKNLYTISNSPENYFALKQVQYNLSQLFDIKQSNRHRIVKQLVSLLGNNFPKIIIRTDISNFYESIDHHSLLTYINEDNLLSPLSRKIINSILRDYKDLTGSSVGVPRGIGISAYLSELYMRRIDTKIKNLSGVSYYARFVDDIVIILNPAPNDFRKDYWTKIKNLIETSNSIRINSKKTFQKYLDENNHNINFEYLGYKYELNHGNVKVRLTKSKCDKIKYRIITSFDHYSHLSKVDEKKARRELVKRIRFLTGNTRLVNNKSKILIGIYHSNKLLTENLQLKGFDRFLKHQIDTRIISNRLRMRLQEYSFEKGFVERKFSLFKAEELKIIMKIWK